MVVDDVEQDVDSPLVRLVDHVAQVLPGPEARIDVEEVLNAVAVIRGEVRPLLEDGPDPQRGHPQATKVVQLAADASDAPSLKGLAGLHPRALVRGGVSGRVGAIEQGAPRFLPITEPIGQQEVENLVAPVEWTGVSGRPRREVGVREP